MGASACSRFTGWSYCPAAVAHRQSDWARLLRRGSSLVAVAVWPCAPVVRRPAWGLAPPSGPWLALRHRFAPPFARPLFGRRLWGFGGIVRLGGGGVRGVGVLASLFEQALLLLLLFLGQLFLSLLEVEPWFCQVDHLSPSPGIPARAPCLRLVWLANVSTGRHGRPPRHHSRLHHRGRLGRHRRSRLGCRRPAAPREAWLR